ncbi:Yip1 family protein [Tengunoibacter tsumagoiensis]|uniref:Yip1 domain-containing protein n=1 Tax=Tengunoibacter tsumagoiensis TaxID=2014871 RepID=A0A402A9S7_9CHLR|nr:Yip1 family protein [Tengunoibacter tsumagoiensis]GCE15934.1 hypothetical protein KTT_57930 [Tengunoibacter tsumagoiensis]
MQNELAQPQQHTRSTLIASYWKVITHPGSQTFRTEKLNARWGSIWLQLLFLSIISTVLFVISSFITPPQVSAVAGMNAETAKSVTIITSAIVTFIVTPISFLVSSAILFGLAKAFKGTGSYLQQTYALVLIGVPMVLLSSLLQLIPATTNWLPYLPHLYSLVLVFFALKGIHDLTSGKALTIILLPLGLLLLLAILISVVVILILPH